MTRPNAAVKIQLTKKVDLSNLVHALKNYPSSPDKSGTEIVQTALHAEGLLFGAIDGKAGPITKAGCAKWQRRCAGGKGTHTGVLDADSLAELGKKHGFTVVA